MTESLRLEEPPRPSPAIKPTLPTPPLNHSRVTSRSVLEHFQGWQVHHFPSWPVPRSDHFFSEEIVSNIQPKPLLVQPRAILSTDNPELCPL